MGPRVDSRKALPVGGKHQVVSDPSPSHPEHRRWLPNLKTTGDHFQEVSLLEEGTGQVISATPLRAGIPAQGRSVQCVSPGGQGIAAGGGVSYPHRAIPSPVQGRGEGGDPWRGPQASVVEPGGSWGRQCRCRRIDFSSSCRDRSHTRHPARDTDTSLRICQPAPSTQDLKHTPPTVLMTLWGM